MRPLLWTGVKAAMVLALPIAAMFGALWACACVLPNVLAVRLGAAGAAAAVGLVQAQGISILLHLGRLNRILNRILSVAAWLAFSATATGPFLNATVGGNARASMQTSLYALRGAAASYHLEHRGTFPLQFESLVVNGASVRIPPAWRGSSGFAARLLPHDPTTGVEYYGNEVCHGATNLHPVREMLRDTGRWGYVGDPKSPCWGMVFIDCTHADFQGRPWADY